MNISELKIEEPFKSLFKMDDHVLYAIRENMGHNGYDESKPITIWRGRNIVIDGHTRLLAADDLEMETIPVKERNFKDEDSALRYALHHQRNRRSLDDAHILHLVEKLDKMYKMGGDRRSIFATAKLDLDEDRPSESSREVTASLIGTTAEKVSQCRHVLQNCDDKEIRVIRDRKKSLHNVYKSSLAVRKNEERKLKEQEIRLKKLQELKTKDFHSTLSKSDVQKYETIVRKLDTLVLELFPDLEKCESSMYRMREIIEFFKSCDAETFRIFCDREPVKQFLGNSFVTDFILMLKCLGYKILTPCTLNVVNKERVVLVKKKRPIPPPHRNISRVHEAGFVSKEEHREMELRGKRAAEQDMEEGII